jgi:hypothetical protein
MMNEKSVVRSFEPRRLAHLSDETKERIFQTDRDSPRTIHVTGESIACTAGYCSNRRACALGQQRLCVHHFITHCFDRLRHCSVSWCLNPLDEPFESSDAFIHECILESAKVLQRSTDIDPVRRGHLLDVFLWASELAIKRGGSK